MAALGLPGQSPNSRHNTMLLFQLVQHGYSGRLHTNHSTLFKPPMIRKGVRTLRAVKSNSHTSPQGSEPEPVELLESYSFVAHACAVHSPCWLPLVPPPYSSPPLPTQLPCSQYLGCLKSHPGNKRYIRHTHFRNPDLPESVDGILIRAISWSWDVLSPDWVMEGY